MTHEVSVTEAAALLGVSTKTIERRIKSKALTARRVSGRWLVSVEVSDNETDSLDTPPPAPTLPAVVDPRLDALLALPEQVAALREEVRGLSEKGQIVVADRLDSVLSYLQEQASELAALRAELERVRRPWWKRWKR